MTTSSPTRSPWSSTADDTLRIEHVAADGTVTVLKESLPVLAGEVVDGTFIDAAALDAFLLESIERAKAEGILFSVHLKATMMKVSDPIIFGHVVKAFFKPVFEKYGQDLAAAGLSANDGLGGIFAGLAALPNGAEIRAAFDAALADGPKMAMVNSDKGITNLHVPSDVIVDASMPAMIRIGGHMWGPEGEEADTLAVIPDSSYAGIYQTVIDDCRANGALDPATMGSVPNVGLMAQAAEEYGSHDKTFEIADRRHRPHRQRRGRRRHRARGPAPATSGAPARPRTPRSATGSSWLSRGPARRAPPRCSG